MKLKILGCHGGRAPGMNLTSYLLDDTILIDAGAPAGTLTIKQQAKIDTILVSHSHLDHIKDIPFLADNIIGMRQTPIEVVGVKPVIDGVRTHFMNNVIWPDFTKIPSPDKPVLAYKTVREDQAFTVGKYEVRFVQVNHPVPCFGMFISDDKGTLAYSADTGYTDVFWRKANKIKNLKAVIVETSFTNAAQWLSELSGHLSPCMLAEELKKLDRPEVPIYVTHLKPGPRTEVRKELRAIGRKNLRPLLEGETLRFG